MEKRATYALALAELETPLLKLEEDAVRIRTTHKEHSDVSIYNSSRSLFPGIFRSTNHVCDFTLLLGIL